MGDTSCSVLKAGRGLTRLRTTGVDARSSATIDIDFDQDGVRRLVKDLCRTADLPEPWKKG
jgi:hypothetical protein